MIDADRIRQMWSQPDLYTKKEVMQAVCDYLDDIGDETDYDQVAVAGLLRYLVDVKTLKSKSKEAERVK